MNNCKNELDAAKLVQEGFLPKARHFKRIFDDFFTIYIPENKISGDFYWVGKKNNFKYLLVGDSTGHGISAALLAVLGINLFEYTIMHKGLIKTNKILQEVDKKFIESFKNVEDKNFDNQWIDLSIVCIDEDKEKLYYSSANRKMLLVRNEQNTLLVKGSRYPIGGWQLEKNRDYKAQVFDYKKGDKLYLGSDGFQDQFGGDKNKKYKSKNLHSFLEKNSNLPFLQQKGLLLNEYNGWKGNNFQTDDICIVGIKL